MPDLLLTALVDRYSFVCQQLSDLHNEIGQARKASVNMRASTYLTLAARGENVTTCREQADASVAHINGDIMELQGRIDAALAELRALDVQITCTYHLLSTPGQLHS